MNYWKEFLDTLNSPGGHIWLLMITVAGMTIANAYGVPKADDMAVGAFAMDGMERRTTSVAIKAFNSNSTMANGSS